MECIICFFSQLQLVGILDCKDRNHLFGLPVFLPWAPQTYIFRGSFMVTNLVFRWPKPIFFMVLGGSYCLQHDPWENEQNTLLIFGIFVTIKCTMP